MRCNNAGSPSATWCTKTVDYIWREDDRERGVCAPCCAFWAWYTMDNLVRLLDVEPGPYDFRTRKRDDPPSLK